MSSLTNPPAKITLARATKISLSDRFAKLAKAKPQVEPAKGGLKTSIGPASAANRKLVAQMGNRSNFQTALKIKKKSIQQRLGTRPGQRNNFNALKNQTPMKNQTNIKRQSLAARLSGDSLPTFNQQNNNKRLNLSQRLNRNKADFKLRRTNNSLNSSKVSNKSVKRIGGPNTNLRTKGKFGNKKIQGMNVKGRFNRGGAGPRWANKPAGAGQAPKSKVNLDKDLDQYMSKSKSHLDTDLDQYMAKSKTHLDADLDTYMAQASSSQQD